MFLHFYLIPNAWTMLASHICYTIVRWWVCLQPWDQVRLLSTPQNAILGQGGGASRFSTSNKLSAWLSLWLAVRRAAQVSALHLLCCTVLLFFVSVAGKRDFAFFDGLIEKDSLRLQVLYHEGQFKKWWIHHPWYQGG